MAKSSCCVVRCCILRNAVKRRQRCTRKYLVRSRWLQLAAHCSCALVLGAGSATAQSVCVCLGLLPYIILIVSNDFLWYLYWECTYVFVSMGLCDNVSDSQHTHCSSAVENERRVHASDTHPNISSRRDKTHSAMQQRIAPSTQPPTANNSL